MKSLTAVSLIGIIVINALIGMALDGSEYLCGYFFGLFTGIIISALMISGFLA